MIDLFKTSEHVAKMTAKSADIRRSFFQHTLLASSSILGILTALLVSTPARPYIRWVFALAVAVLVLGILTNVVTLYIQSRRCDRAHRAMIQEYATALLERRDAMSILDVQTTAQTSFEIATYSLLSSALVLLGTYAICSTLLP